jgi:hypothetical protein
MPSLSSVSFASITLIALFFGRMPLEATPPLVGKFESYEGSSLDSKSNLQWDLGLGYEFLLNGKVLVHSYWNEGHISSDSEAPDYSVYIYYYKVLSPHEILVTDTRGKKQKWHYWWKNNNLYLEAGVEPRGFVRVDKFKFEDQLRANLR